MPFPVRWQPTLHRAAPGHRRCPRGHGAGGGGLTDSTGSTLSPGQSTTAPKAPKGQSEDSVPDEESDDFRAKDQPSGVMDAQCGRRSSTGFRNLRPWGPHITSGLSSVSPVGEGWLDGALLQARSPRPPRQPSAPNGASSSQMQRL